MYISAGSVEARGLRRGSLQSVLDANPWYSIFSMIILPINSVINPFLYDDAVSGILNAMFHPISIRITNSTIYQNMIQYFSTTIPEVINMEPMEVRVGGTRSEAGICLQTPEREAEDQQRNDSNHRNEDTTPDV